MPDPNDLPLPSSPDRLQTDRAGTGASSGIRSTAESGVQREQRDRGDAHSAAVRPAAPSGSAGKAPGSPEAAGARPAATDAATPIESDPASPAASDDNALESLGKAIAAPIEGAAEDDGKPDRPAPGR